MSSQIKVSKNIRASLSESQLFEVSIQWSAYTVRLAQFEFAFDSSTAFKTNAEVL